MPNRLVHRPGRDTAIQILSVDFLYTFQCLTGDQSIQKMATGCFNRKISKLAFFLLKTQSGDHSAGNAGWIWISV